MNTILKLAVDLDSPGQKNPEISKLRFCELELVNFEGSLRVHSIVMTSSDALVHLVLYTCQPQCDKFIDTNFLEFTNAQYLRISLQTKLPTSSSINKPQPNGSTIPSSHHLFSFTHQRFHFIRSIISAGGSFFFHLLGDSSTLTAKKKS
jgi:hypothetical protein